MCLCKEIERTGWIGIDDGVFPSNVILFTTKADLLIQSELPGLLKLCGVPFDHFCHEN